MTVAQNIGFGLEMLGQPKAETDARVAEMLKLVRMEALANRRTSQISGGQQQRVALARALAPQPEGAAARRAALGARLQAPQGDADRAEAAAARDRHHLHLRHPRPGGGADHVRPDRGDVSRARSCRSARPRDIYDNPADRFVADFIGETNLLTAELIARRRAIGRVGWRPDPSSRRASCRRLPAAGPGHRRGAAGACRR